MSGMVRGVRRLTRNATRVTARDASAAVASRSALVIAPHPDDETLGCGATILHKVAAGSEVTILVVTDGSRSHRSPHLPPAELAALRREEMVEAARRLGLPADAVHWAGFADETLAEHEDQLTDVFAQTIAELRPQEVYATCVEEPHADHAAVGAAARRAVRATGGDVRLLEYAVWLWGAWPLRRGDRMGSMLDALGLVLRRQVIAVPAGRHRAAKMHALQAHRSQLERPAGVPSDEDWPSLPPEVLAAAAGPVELFFPVPEGGHRSIERLNSLLVPFGGVLASAGQVLNNLGDHPAW
jgi:LmbE family N-acetylglucosaminyl deacetylase